MKRQRFRPRDSADMLFGFVASSENGRSWQEIKDRWGWSRGKFQQVVRHYRDFMEAEGEYHRILINTMGPHARWYVVPIRVLVDQNELENFERWADGRITRLDNEVARLVRTLSVAKKMDISVPNELLEQVVTAAGRLQSIAA